MATEPTDNDTVPATILASFRLECIKIASTWNAEASKTVADAATLYAFVQDGPAPAAPEQ